MKNLIQFSIKICSISGLLAISLTFATLTYSVKVTACPSQPYIGGICAFAGNFAPRDWAFANGALLSISQNTAMFSLLGTNFGGDGRTTFGLPDLQGRGIVGAGNGPGLSPYSIGQKAGSERATLTVSQIPSHSHGASTSVTMVILGTDVTIETSLNAYASPGASNNPQGNILAANGATQVFSSSVPNIEMSTNAIESTINATVNSTTTTTLTPAGAGNSHENRMPYLAINWIIATSGLFPSRN